MPGYYGMKYDKYTDPVKKRIIMPQSTDAGMDQARALSFDRQVNVSPSGNAPMPETPALVDNSQTRDSWENRLQKPPVIPSVSDGQTAQAPQSWSQEKMFGNLNTGDFVSLTGDLANAIAPNTPMGRAGGVLANYAGAEKQRLAKAADKASEREAEIAKENRRFAFEKEMTSGSQAHAVGMARENRDFTKSENELNRSFDETRDIRKETGADTRSRAAMEHDLKLANIREAADASRQEKSLAAQGRQVVIGDDGSVNVVNTQTGEKKTVEGIKSPSKTKGKGELTNSQIIEGKFKQGNLAVKNSGEMDPVVQKEIFSKASTDYEAAQRGWAPRKVKTEGHELYGKNVWVTPDGRLLNEFGVVIPQGKKEQKDMLPAH